MADELLRDRPADAALAEWLDRFVVYAVRKRGSRERWTCATRSY